MIGKIGFALGIVVFIAAIVAAVLQGMQHAAVVVPQPAAGYVQQYLDMAKQLWLVEAFALGFVLVGGGLLLWSPKKDDE